MEPTNMASDARCRTCMSQEVELQPIFYESKAAERSLPKIIEYVTGIKIEEHDGYPKQICNPCVGLAQSALLFKEQCVQAHAAFKKSNLLIGLIKEEQECNAEDDILMQNENPYQCAVCNNRFPTCSELKGHVNQVHEELTAENISDTSSQQTIAPTGLKLTKSKFSCELCSKQFISKRNYNTHFKRCLKIAPKPSRDKEIKEEVINSDSDTPLVENCRQDSSDNDDDTLIEPDRIKLEPDSVLVTCDDLENAIFGPPEKTKQKTCTECNTSFPLKLYKIHMRKVHRISSAKRFKSQRHTSGQNGYDRPKKKKFLKKKTLLSNRSIDNFNNAFPNNETVNGFGVEIKRNVPYSCTMCQRKFSKESTLTLHLKKHEDQLMEIHTCEVCKREFKRRAHLDNHVLTHSVDKGFKCGLCPKAFARQDSLAMHQDNHKGLKKHQCTFCDKGFNMLSTLKDHIRTHTGEKPFLCSICGRGFSQSTNLKEHVRRHQGFKPFKCDHCDQTFVSKGELEAHTRKHSGAHPFVCDVCGGGFTTSSSLVKHKRIHTGERPYQCDFCPMRFTALGTLKNHRRTHTGEKPYKCIYCDKAFAQKNDLVSHTRTHTGERPYVCAVCGHAFRQSSALKTHFKIHGGVPTEQEPVKLETGMHKPALLQVEPIPMQIVNGFVPMPVPKEDDVVSVDMMTPKSETSH